MCRATTQGMRNVSWIKLQHWECEMSYPCSYNTENGKYELCRATILVKGNVNHGELRYKEQGM